MIRLFTTGLLFILLSGCEQKTPQTDIRISYLIYFMLFAVSFSIINSIAILLSRFINKEKELTRKRIVTLVIPFTAVYIVSIFILFEFLKTFI